MPKTISRRDLLSLAVATPLAKAMSTRAFGDRQTRLDIQYLASSPARIVPSLERDNVTQISVQSEIDIKRKCLF